MDLALDIRGAVREDGTPILTWVLATEMFTTCFAWPVPSNVQETIQLADQIYETIIKESAKAFREATSNVNNTLPETPSPDSLVPTTGEAQESEANSEN